VGFAHVAPRVTAVLIVSVEPLRELTALKRRLVKNRADLSADPLTSSVVDADAVELLQFRSGLPTSPLIGVMIVGLVVAIKKQIWTIPAPGRPGCE
jgi:hypothetical protein